MSSTVPSPKKLHINDQTWMHLRRELVRVIRVKDDQDELAFRCETPEEVWRAKTAFEKELGTVRWIRENVRAGDVFYDVGANVGVYSLLAARRVGESGGVYSFEPHLANALSLMHNFKLNSLASRAKVLSCALNDAEGFLDFHYFATMAGSSMSQLNETKDSLEKEFQPALTEFKYAITADRLLNWGAIRPANLIKIDVDGNELLVLKGMRDLLTRHKPRSVQVEINERCREEVMNWMRGCGYQLAYRHYTQAGQQILAQGGNGDEIAYNAVFEPA